MPDDDERVSPKTAPKMLCKNCLYEIFFFDDTHTDEGDIEAYSDMSPAWYDAAWKSRKMVGRIRPGCKLLIQFGNKEMEVAVARSNGNHFKTKHGQFMTSPLLMFAREQNFNVVVMHLSVHFLLLFFFSLRNCSICNNLWFGNTTASMTKKKLGGVGVGWISHMCCVLRNNK